MIEEGIREHLPSSLEISSTAQQGTVNILNRHVCQHPSVTLTNIERHAKQHRSRTHNRPRNNNQKQEQNPKQHTEHPYRALKNFFLHSTYIY
jgi:hypothetical protein